MFKKVVGFVLLFASFSFAEMNHMHMKKMFQSVPVKKADIRQDVKDKYSCVNCGMNLPKFYKTSHMVEFKDGKYRQYCSIHCLADVLENGELKDKKATLKEFYVVDVTSEKYIPVSKAFYVVGSDIRGTMSMVSKYAFSKREDALSFIEKNGGKLKDFRGAYKIALRDFSGKKMMGHNH